MVLSENLEISAYGSTGNGARMQGELYIHQAHSEYPTSHHARRAGLHHPHLPRESQCAVPILLPSCWEKPRCCSEGINSQPPSRQEQQFVPFLRETNCGAGVNVRISNEPVTPTGKVGTWKTNTSGSNIIWCHAALGEA